MSGVHSEHSIRVRSDSTGVGVQTGTLAEQVIAPVLPSRRTASAAAGVRPLPLAQLGPLRRDGSTCYGIASMDHRGRVAKTSVVHALRWKPGTSVDIEPAAGSVVIRADANGLFTVTGRGHIPIPASVRRRCELSAGDRVFLVAAPEFGVLVVHPMSALDAMVLAYHRSLGEETEP